jgi:hypothetical protein
LFFSSRSRGRSTSTPRRSPGWPDWVKFSHRAIVYFGHFLKISEVAQTFELLFSLYVSVIALIWT